MDIPRIALIVDHPQRDLAGIVLTAFELCQRGAICHLVPLNIQEREIWALMPDIVLLNYFRVPNEPLGRRMLQAGIHFGLLDTEGGVWPDLDSYGKLLWRDRSLLKQASCVCMWGPRMSRYVVEQRFFSDEQVDVTGCPRFDFYNPSWFPVLARGGRGSDIPNGSERDQDKKRILINTNYSIVNSRFASPERNAEQLRVESDLPRSKVEEMVSAETQALHLTVQLVRKLATDYPEVEITLRPHPFEKPEFYRSRLDKLVNFEVNQVGPVGAQIFRSSAVIQRSCTTAIEAAMASVPTLSPQWIPAPMINPGPEAVSVGCASYLQMRLHLDNIFAQCYTPSTETKQAIEGVIHDWFYKVDGQAHKRVSDAIMARLNSRRVVDENRCSRFAYGSNDSTSGALTHLARSVRRFARLSTDWSFSRMKRVPDSSWNRTEKYFGYIEVEELVDKISGVMRSKGVDAKPVKVGLARNRGELANGYFGHSVTMTRGA